MSIDSSNTGVEPALDPVSLGFRDPIVLCADDVRAAYRLADNPRLSDAQLVAYAADSSWAGHERVAETYRKAVSIRERQRAAANPIQGPVSWPLCGICGVEYVAWTVHCTADDGGELLVCDAHEQAGEHFVEYSAINRTSAVRVDQYSHVDVAAVVNAA